MDKYAPSGQLCEIREKILPFLHRSSVERVFLPAFGHQGTSEGAAWSKQENRGAAAGSICSLHTVRTTVAAGSAAKGRDVQE